jgi:hypothetical protein
MEQFEHICQIYLNFSWALKIKGQINKVLENNHDVNFAYEYGII